MIVVWIIVGVVAVCAAAVIIRTATQKAPAPSKRSYVPNAELEKACGEKLGAMVRVPTLSKNENEDLSEFYRLHGELERLFPLIHKNLEKTVLGGNLIYRWAGKDSGAKPILLMGHQDVVPASDEGWSVGAFSGAVKEGCIYGRGAMDCKSTMLVELEAVERLLAEGFLPECD
ncbi:MAG: M20/M25/M40 family metallo-hydrolase, partial [Oscillospiraceae bacterium]|nr:M20/M25/M40 family metallo-hydrolase [Oscillospiraceae bacterium]